MILCKTVEALKQEVKTAKNTNKTIGLVPTMLIKKSSNGFHSCKSKDVNSGISIRRAVPRTI